MKLERWIEKMRKRSEEMINNGAALYENTDAGLYFCPKSGTIAYFCADCQIIAPVWDEMAGKVDSLHRYFEAAVKDSTLASARAGVLPGVLGARDRNVFVFTNEKGVSAVVDKKLLRDFPKNTLFYVSSSIRPVLAGILENGVLNVIGIVCPINAPADAVRFEDQGAAAAD